MTPNPSVRSLLAFSGCFIASAMMILNFLRYLDNVPDVTHSILLSNHSWSQAQRQGGDGSGYLSLWPSWLCRELPDVVDPECVGFGGNSISSSPSIILLINGAAQAGQRTSETRSSSKKLALSSPNMAGNYPAEI